MRTVVQGAPYDRPHLGVQAETSLLTAAATRAEA